MILEVSIIQKNSAKNIIFQHRWVSSMQKAVIGLLCSWAPNYHKYYLALFLWTRADRLK